MNEYFRLLQDRILNKTIYLNKYKTNNEGIVLACYFNPYNSKLRYDIFMKWYQTIRHLPHLIVEGCYETDKFNLSEVPVSNKILYSLPSKLWHKESLLNEGIKSIYNRTKNRPKYVFWLDTDIRFENLKWFDEACKLLESSCYFIQPFSIVKHLKEGDDFLTYSENIRRLEKDAVFYLSMSVTGRRPENTDTWFSFGQRHFKGQSSNKNYESHGHVGMAWGARLDKLTQVMLYDKGLIGGADHVMAHAISGDYNHSCISKSFGEDKDLLTYSLKLEAVAKGKLGFVGGQIYHEWHGDLKKRDYFKRIKDSSPIINENLKKEGGFYVSDNEHIFTEYMMTREILDTDSNHYESIPDKTNSFDGFKGGEFGGGGASGLWDQSKADEITESGKENLGILVDALKDVPFVDTNENNTFS